MKRLTLLTLILSLIMVMTCPVFAESTDSNPVSRIAVAEDDLIARASTSGCTLSFVKESSTKAQAQISATRPGVTSITSTIRLQKKSGSSYVNTDQYATKTVKQVFISHAKTFSINSSNTYRIKVTIKYVENGKTYSDTYYKTLS